MDLLLFDIGAIPAFGVIDKRYIITAIIVETFFDCAYNPNLNTYLTYKFD